MASTALVTGISGFIGLHCARELLQRGFRVRGTLRSLSRSDSIRETLRKHADGIGERLEFASADLTKDEGWSDAVVGCEFVLHIASPLPRTMPKHEDELIVPARDGALRVLRAAAASGVKRVVMTSSVAAIAYGHGANHGRTLTEDDWSNLDNAVPAYPRSKTLAERAAWDFVQSHERKPALELVVINPGVVLGPVLDEDWGTSGELVRRLMAGEVPALPKIGWAAVDVRDVAAAHVEAMVTPAAAGQRFCCAIEHVWIRDIASVLRRRFGDQAFKIPSLELPNTVLRIAALFDRSLGVIVPEIGKREDVSSERIRRVLGWKPRSLEEMVVAMAESLIEHGVVSAR